MGKVRDETAWTSAGGYPTKQFPEQVIKALQESNNKLLAKESSRSPMAKRIIESRRDYLKKSRAWTNIGVKAYLDSMSK